MLDFYLITDEQPKPNGPGNTSLAMAGSLDDTSFDRLQRKGIIGERFDCHHDFRWSRTVVLQMQAMIVKRSLEADTDVQKLLRLLGQAVRNNSGLIGYAD